MVNDAINAAKAQQVEAHITMLRSNPELLTAIALADSATIEQVKATLDKGRVNLDAISEGLTVFPEIKRP